MRLLKPQILVKELLSDIYTHNIKSHAKVGICYLRKSAFTR